MGKYELSVTQTRTIDLLLVIVYRDWHYLIFTCDLPPSTVKVNHAQKAFSVRRLPFRRKRNADGCLIYKLCKNVKEGRAARILQSRSHRKLAA